MISDTLIKIIAGALIILALGWYVMSLQSNIKTKDAKIVELNAHLLVQNSSIENSKKEKERIEDSLNKTSKENKKLSNDLVDAKAEIDKRDKAKTCEDAVSNLSNTASNAAADWNSK